MSQAPETDGAARPPAPPARRPSALRVVAVDMDGTFLRTGSTYDRDRFAPLRSRMREAGVRFVVASGNQEAQLLGFFPAADGLAPDGVVSDNGAIVLADGARLLETHVPMDALARVLAVLDDAAGLTFIASGPDGAYLRESETPEMRELLTFYHPQYQYVAHTADINGHRVSKIALVDKRGFTQVFLDRLSAALEGAMVPVVSGHDSVDLIVPGRHKASGLDVLLDHWGLTRGQAAAFGDSGNDAEMLTGVGYGIAMENASPAARRGARFTAPANDDDGVLQVLDAWFPAD
ncbi:MULTISPECIES: Cof-type HAD-IIB family hydrolase [unclassified Actinomyces]|uniref:Cof-type HAD-IIB family hydrolase n=1 Tax=unclassified Actinomyces TaxID=2609248 RepID=UPI0013A6A6EB|nr:MULTISPECIES: Cof-type HAD-IIB family hydrolase [unclassified Actinomyces]MBW3069010.1 HAD family hydrolase [Actinomyces sp. 594]NDR54072.1 HAD family hydrolase [Actinomyces sp. 565]